MTPDTQQVRLALRRAAGRTSAAVAVRVEGEPCSAGVFLVPSRSVPGDTYGLTLRGDGTLVCPCPGFTHRQRCRHVVEVAAAVLAETRLTREAAAARLQEIAEEFAK